MWHFHLVNIILNAWLSKSTPNTLYLQDSAIAFLHPLLITNFLFPYSCYKEKFVKKKKNHFILCPP